MTESVYRSIISGTLTCLFIDKSKDWNRSIVDDAMNKDLPSVQSVDKGYSNSGFRRSECLQRSFRCVCFGSGNLTQRQRGVTRDKGRYK